jgi:hypothetical protein
MSHPVVWMLGAGLACWLGATAAFGSQAHLATLLGMAGPLVVGIATWRLAAQTYRRDPASLTGLMMGAFVAKMVFFGAYVVVVIKGLAQPAVPFAASFTAAFIAVYAIEALALKRLFEG